MIYEIKNNYLKVKISSTGAELQSIKKINDNVEYLWQLNPDIWERQAPLLFPIIGRLKDESYRYKDTMYKIQIHGFARDAIFEIGKKTDSLIDFILEYSKDTLKEYPFKFRLHIIYEFKDNTIIKKHIIENIDNDVMYYEIGGHEGYNLALFSDEVMEDYYIEFVDGEELYTYTADEDILITDKKIEVELDNNRLYMSPEVFKNDALIIDTIKTRSVILKNTKNDRYVKVDFDDYRYLGIWTKYQRTNYVCIEPWSSLPDCNYLDYDLKNKENIMKLEKGESQELKYKITIG